MNSKKLNQIAKDTCFFEDLSIFYSAYKSFLDRVAAEKMANFF